MSEQLEQAAGCGRMPVARYVRQLVADAVAGRPVDRPDLPTEAELLDLLAEMARQGNVAAIRSLLLREAEKAGSWRCSKRWQRSGSHGELVLAAAGPEYLRELVLVARALRESGDREALALFGLDVSAEPLVDDYGDAYERVAEVARRADHETDAFYLATAVVGFDGPYFQRALAGMTSAVDDELDHPPPPDRCERRVSVLHSGPPRRS